MEEMFESSPTIDYLALAKANLDTLRSRSPAAGSGANLRSYVLEEASLAAQIAQAQATFQLTSAVLGYKVQPIYDADRLPFEKEDAETCAHNIPSNLVCVDCRSFDAGDEAYRRVGGSTESDAETCVHDVDVNSNPKCVECLAMLPEDGPCPHGVNDGVCDDCHSGQHQDCRICDVHKITSFITGRVLYDLSVKAALENLAQTGIGDRVDVASNVTILPEDQLHPSLVGGALCHEWRDGDDECIFEGCLAPRPSRP